MFCYGMWCIFQAFGLNATLTVGTVFCGSNLQDKFPQRSTILPLVEASMEFSVFTKTPQGAPQKKAHQVLTERIKRAGEKTLVERGQQLVAELLEKKQKMTLGQTPTVRVQYCKHFHPLICSPFYSCKQFRPGLKLGFKRDNVRHLYSSSLIFTHWPLGKKGQK